MKPQKIHHTATRYSCLAILLLAMSFQVSAQNKFEKAYGNSLNNFGRYAIPTAASGYAMAGFTQTNSNMFDIYFIEIDSCGNFIRNRTIGGANDDEAQVICQNGVGDFVMAGFTQSYGFGQADAYVVRLTTPTLNTGVGYPFGDSLQDVSEYMTIMSNGNYALTGRTTSVSSGAYDVFLARVTPAGVLVFKSYGGSSNDRGYSIRQTSDGGFIIAGGTESFGAGSSDFYLIKTTSTGGLSWTKTFGGPKYDEAYDVKQTLDGGYIVVGKTKDRDNNGASGDDIYVVKTLSNGSLQWSKVYGGTGDESAESVIQNQDSSYIVAGYTNSYGHGNNDAYLLKLSKTGTLVWSRTYGGTNDDRAFSVEPDLTNVGYILCGQTKSYGSGANDFYFIKTDHDGHTGCDSSGATSYTPPDSISSGGSTKSGGKITSNFAKDSVTTVQDSACGICIHFRLAQIESESQNLYLYPNPAYDKINLTFIGNLEGKSAITIYDQLGRVVYQRRDVDAGDLLEAVAIDVSNFGEGVYTVQLNNKTLNIAKVFMVVK